MGSKVLQKAFIQNDQKLEEIERIVTAISRYGWFEDEDRHRTWLRTYLLGLYGRGLVLRDELALCGLAAAKHRFRYDDTGRERTAAGAYGPEDIKLMGAIFGLANRNPTVPKDSIEARTLARRVMRLYKAGYHDPESVLELLKSL
ncbi:hypothetical protein J2Y48_002308 [Mycoplana sp. BE70]|uniref:hypothetical protein n=1 Tax=Mycoplana sp. BE70 TaxID=2817775 RepID=UPI00285E7403|nr:hypothetical protein [Mycoplana sp. BE70]MDR6757012.1 hypothetical protein [Mycoplana sp. BE70]